MDPEFSKFIDEAAAIASSGRWEAVNSRIEALCAHPGGPDNVWWVELIASLCSQSFTEYLSLKRVYEDPKPDDAALLAWSARNLLELSVWSIYSSKSRDNARRVYEDSRRDARDIYNAFLKWGTATAKPAEWLDPIATAMQDLSQKALSLDGIQSLEGPYKSVKAAASECHFGEHFDVGYKMLSKFAHPTAMRILAPPDDEREAAVQRDLFWANGCLYFGGAFEALEGLLRA